MANKLFVRKTYDSLIAIDKDGYDLFESIPMNTILSCELKKNKNLNSDEITDEQRSIAQTLKIRMHNCLTYIFRRHNRNRLCDDFKSGKIMQKVQRWREPKYLKWVRGLDSRVSMQPANDAHHIINVIKSGTGTKVHDIFTMPLTRYEHNKIHRVGGKAWDKQTDDNQAEMVLYTINKALEEGKIEINWIGD